MADAEEELPPPPAAKKPDILEMLAKTSADAAQIVGDNQYDTAKQEKQIEKQRRKSRELDEQINMSSSTK